MILYNKYNTNINEALNASDNLKNEILTQYTKVFTRLSWHLLVCLTVDQCDVNACRLAQTLLMHYCWPSPHGVSHTTVCIRYQNTQP